MTSAAERLAPGALLWRSIAKKQVVALTGGLLVLFIMFHMAGNLLILGGRDLFNAYAGRLESLGPLLWVVRIGLFATFVAHIYFTILVTLENRRARAGRYEVFEPKDGQHWATKTMIYTGLLVFAFLFLHLYDFSLSDRHSSKAVILAASTQDPQGLFGLVWNRFLNVPRSIFYIVAVTAVGMHLSHGFQSTFQTFGIDRDQFNGLVDKVSVILGVIVALGFSAIPIYVIIRANTVGVGI